MSTESSDRRQAEALGVGLLALALLLGLALVPPVLADAGEPNPAGPVGGALHRWVSRAFGPSALLVLPAPLAWGFALLGLSTREQAARWSILCAGCLVLFPAALWILGGGPDGAAVPGAGLVGRTLGGTLSAAFGAGAMIIVAGVIVALSVLTFGWSPGLGLARAGRWGVQAATDALRAAGALSGRVIEGARTGLGDVGAGDSPWERAGGGGDAARPPGTGDGEAGESAEEGEAGPDSPGGQGARASRLAEAELADPGDLAQTELPPLELLAAPPESGPGLSERELRELGQKLIDKLGTFRVEGEIRGWTTGPVVTQFEVVPAPGVKVGQIAALSDDLALALKAPSVRIVAPIPGKGAVGVEVPNPEPEVVRLREVLESRAYRRSQAVLPLALGRDLAGTPYCTDLTRMPHLLIAGATGSGKSVCINTIITSLVFRYTPRQLRLLMVDPKMVELSVYDDLPHLRHPVVTDNEEAAAVLKWTVYEMNRRYALLSANAARNLEEFNRRVVEDRPVRNPHGEDDEPYREGELPYVVLVIDELADLIMTVQSEVESPLAMLAQKARAVGIHLVIATQRPSVNVITGLIKANFPSRIAFRVASKTDSRTILDQNGAEALLGNGDMLFLPPGESDPVRIQGAFISSRETERIVDWYREEAGLEAGPERAPEAEKDILDFVEEREAEEARVDVVEEVLEDRDDLFRQAAEVVITHDSGSTSLLQRRLKIGYGRAARIIDQLHHAGVVGPSQGSQPREVLVTLDELEDVIE